MKSCKQCGTCCKKGGPALHHSDTGLIASGVISWTDLITIRKGEPVFSPLTERVEPSREEIVKVSAQNSWTCPFFRQAGNQCSIYLHRPEECRLLQCWDTAALTAVIYRDCINRWDLIGPGTPILEQLKKHEQECSYLLIEELLTSNSGPGGQVSGKVRAIIARDLAIRQEAVTAFKLSLPEELFFFGRPLFKSLDYFQRQDSRPRTDHPPR